MVQLLSTRRTSWSAVPFSIFVTLLVHSLLDKLASFGTRCSDDAASETVRDANSRSKVVMRPLTSCSWFCISWIRLSQFVDSWGLLNMIRWSWVRMATNSLLVFIANWSARTTCWVFAFSKCCFFSFWFRICQIAEGTMYHYKMLRNSWLRQQISWNPDCMTHFNYIAIIFISKSLLWLHNELLSELCLVSFKCSFVEYKTFHSWRVSNLELSATPALSPEVMSCIVSKL